MGRISRVVDSCADSCYCCFYLARLYKCDTMGMGVKKSQKTRQRLPNTACTRLALRAVNSGESCQHRFGLVTESSQTRASG